MLRLDSGWSSKGAGWLAKQELVTRGAVSTVTVRLLT